jgi:SM-20-related protein
MVAKVLDEFLTRAGAKATKHSGGSLFDHLKGTHDLLRNWGNPEHVCNAGLFHSIYGTQHFRKQSVPFTERPTVRALIGAAAEYLTYLFCVIDRPKVFLDGEAMFQRHLFDRHSHQIVSVTHQIRDELVEIEAANLLDQGTSAATLARLQQMGVSRPAQIAIQTFREHLNP